MIDLGTVSANKGLIIRSPTPPDLANNPRFTNSLWLDNSFVPARLKQWAGTNYAVDTSTNYWLTPTPASIIGSQIASNTIQGYNLIDGAIDRTTLFGDKTVPTLALADRAVTSVKLGIGAVNNTNINANAVTAGAVAGAAIHATNMMAPFDFILNYNASNIGIITNITAQYITNMLIISNETKIATNLAWRNLDIEKLQSRATNIFDFYQKAVIGATLDIAATNYVHPFTEASLSPWFDNWSGLGFEGGWVSGDPTLYGRFPLNGSFVPPVGTSSDPENAVMVSTNGLVSIMRLATSSNTAAVSFEFKSSVWDSSGTGLTWCYITDQSTNLIQCGMFEQSDYYATKPSVTYTCLITNKIPRYFRFWTKSNRSNVSLGSNYDPGISGLTNQTLAHLRVTIMR